ncbi:MAG: TDP-N-acetylfucosamine:lipid II N-acetylfucosaminyltransferase [Paludibacteraceae bacterium]|nr:TDP-N-acetylfucosamine:lipid II N-acetylfucosaminyltransferase [Paludibacteraceae bacterium]
MKLRILNIINDEKFIDNVIECQDLFFMTSIHDYVIVGQEIKEFKYIKRLTSRIQFVKDRDFLSFIREMEYDAIFLHSYVVLKPELVLKIPKNIKVFWFAWGCDIYSLPLEPFIKIKLYGSETEKIVKKLSENASNITKLKSLIKRITGYKKIYDKLKSQIYYRSISRVDYFSGIIDIEYQLMTTIPNFRAKEVKYTYTSIVGMNTLPNGVRYNGNNVLIGNSAAISNNHLDILTYIKDVKLNDSIIYMPLSYAGPREYVDIVKKSYMDIFNDNFIPLDTFMDYQEYSKMISSCSVAIFFHERQQGLGNICLALRNGCKVFLSETSILYKYFKSHGINIFSLQSDFSQDEWNKPLTDEQIFENKQILYKLSCADTYIKNMNYIFDCVINNDHVKNMSIKNE